MGFEHCFILDRKGSRILKVWWSVVRGPPYDSPLNLPRPTSSVLACRLQYATSSGDLRLDTKSITAWTLVPLMK